MVTAAVGLSAAAGIVTWRAFAASRHRDGLLRVGTLRELGELSVSVDGARVFYRATQPRRSAGALPVVLLHGWGVSSSYLMPMAERLASEFAVYAPDLPGHGRSATPRTAHGIGDHARTLLAWMDAVGLERVALVGHSMGAQVAVQAALEAPERIDRLVLMGMPDLRSRNIVDHSVRFARSNFHERISLHPRVLRDFARMGRRLLAEYRLMRDDGVADKLAKITQPALLLRGASDRMSPLRWNEAAAQLLRASGVIVIPRWGHAVQFDARDETVAAIRPFLLGALAAVDPALAYRPGSQPPVA